MRDEHEPRDRPAAADGRPGDSHDADREAAAKAARDAATEETRAPVGIVRSERPRESQSLTLPSAPPVTTARRGVVVTASAVTAPA